MPLPSWVYHSHQQASPVISGVSELSVIIHDPLELLPSGLLIKFLLKQKFGNWMITRSRIIGFSDGFLRRRNLITIPSLKEANTGVVT